MSTLEMCKKYFGTADVYKVFGLSRNASQLEIQRAYHSLSLKTHPDRVVETEKEMATRKFQILSKLNGVLTNPEKKKIFDETGTIKDDDNDNVLPVPTFLITSAHVENCKQLYVGSALEESAIREAYLEKTGNIKHIIKRVPFLTDEDEGRVIKLIEEWIASDQVPNYFAVPAKKPKNK